MARNKTRKSKGKRQRDTRLKRSAPKYSSQDLIKALGISGLVLGMFVGLFFFQVDGKNGIEHVVGLFGSDEASTGIDANREQLDRYTEDESKALDEIIRKKAK